MVRAIVADAAGDFRARAITRDVTKLEGGVPVGAVPEMKNLDETWGSGSV